MLRRFANASVALPALLVSGCLFGGHGKSDWQAINLVKEGTPPAETIKWTCWPERIVKGRAVRVLFRGGYRDNNGNHGVSPQGVHFFLENYDAGGRVAGSDRDHEPVTYNAGTDVKVCEELHWTGNVDALDPPPSFRVVDDNGRP